MTIRHSIENIGEIVDLRSDPRAEDYWRRLEPMVETVKVFMKTNCPITDVDRSPLGLWRGSACRRKKLAANLWILYRSIEQNGYAPRDNDRIGIRLTRNGLYAFYGGTHRAAILMAMNCAVPAQLVEFRKEP